MNAYWVDGRVEPWQPKRALRTHAADTLAIGAIRVARRGAGRCVAHDCAIEGGAVIASDGKDAKRTRGASSRDYCAPCEARSAVRRPREAEEAERAMFAAATATVLPEFKTRGSRQQRRRVARSSD